MPTPFAAREARLNAAVFKHLANAAGVLDGEEVEGIFDKPYVTGNVGAAGMATDSPTFALATALVPADVEGKAFVYDSVTYRVMAHQPDGSGNSLLLLEVEE